MAAPRVRLVNNWAVTLIGALRIKAADVCAPGWRGGPG
jgi:hypothetical protein